MGCGIGRGWVGAGLVALAMSMEPSSASAQQGAVTGHVVVPGGHLEWRFVPRTSNGRRTGQWRRRAEERWWRGQFVGRIADDTADWRSPGWRRPRWRSAPDIGRRSEPYVFDRERGLWVRTVVAD